MVVDVLVKPSSKKGPLVQPGLDGSLTIFVREPAIDGRANRAVIGLLSSYFEIPKNSVEIISGLTSKRKRFKINNL